MAALLGLLAALGMAIFVFVPALPDGQSYSERVAGWAPLMFAAAGNGAAFGLLPIGWIVLAAIFLYNLTVSAGQFDIVKHSVASLSDDRRIQALLIAFSFGAFVEGAAGFGTPVAVSAALMLGAGFKPRMPRTLRFCSRTPRPVAFGAQLQHADPDVGQHYASSPEPELSKMAGRQLPSFFAGDPRLAGLGHGGLARQRLGVWPAARWYVAAALRRCNS